MAECRDFFQELTSGSRRSSSSDEYPSISTLQQSVQEDHCLELTLGLGAPTSSSSFQVNPSSGYNCLPTQTAPPISTSNGLQIPPVQFDSLEGPQNFTGQPEVAVLAKQRSGNLAFGGAHLHPIFGGQVDTGVADGGIPSRDQIWMTLQKNGTVFGQNTDQQKETSSIWSRRSASMHVVISGKDADDVENCQIRRSSSIGVGGHAQNYQIRRSSSSGIAPHTVLRHRSSIDSSLNDRSPQQNSLSIQGQDQESLEKRKEMQAQRTQEARKRRKILIEEKQLKKSKHSSGLQRLGSRQSISLNDRFSFAATPSNEDGVTAQSHCGTLDASQQESQGKVRENVSMIQSSCAEDAEQETHPVCVKDDKVSMFASSIEVPSHSMHAKEGMPMHGYDTTCSVPLKDGALNHLSHNHNSGSHGSMVTCEFEQSTSGGNCVSGSKFHSTGNRCNRGSSNSLHAPTVVAANAGARMTEDEGKSCETDCFDSSSLQNSVNLPQCATTKAEVGAMVSSASSMSATTSGPMNYAPFPCLAVPYPYTVEPSTHTVIPMQPVFPFPFLVQYPVSSHSENGSSSIPGTCSATGVNSVTPFPVSLMSKASSPSKDCVGGSFEGHGCSSEKPVSTPLLRTASNLKHPKEEGQSLGVPVDLQATFPTSQLRSLGSFVSDACNGQLEKQQSMPIGGIFSSRISSARSESTHFSVHESPILTQNGVDVRQETSTLRVGMKEVVKLMERVRKDEASVDSQLTSERSGADASYAQPGSVERQKSGSFSDLPWVTTTGKGPNGKTISGVMYIVNGRHVRLVCCCHGKNMSPAEFVEHSGSSDLSNPERHIVVSPFPSFNRQLASAPAQTSNLES